MWHSVMIQTSYFTQGFVIVGSGQLGALYSVVCCTAELYVCQP